MAGAINGGALFGADKESMSVIIPTVVQTASDFLQYWTGMTCIFDPYWVQEQDRQTLPIAFFQVTSWKEIGRTTVSKKRVMLYEPQDDGQKDAKDLIGKVRPSVMRAIVDNAVRDPKEYSITAVLPYQPFGRYVADGLSVISSTMSVFTSMLGIQSSDAVKGINNAFAAAQAAGGLVQRASDAVTKLASVGGVTFINKNSLDAMWEAGHFLCLKTWLGYDYKYVMITNIEVDKKGTEDDVFRVTMQLQEVPVLTVTRPKAPQADAVKYDDLTKVLRFGSAAVSDVLSTLTGVKGATTAEGAPKKE